MQESLNSYRRLGESLIDGSFVLGQLDILKSHISRAKRSANVEWKDEFQVLLEYAGCDKDLKMALIKKLDVYQKLKRVQQITKILLELKKVAKLTGSFEMLSDIISSVSF